MTMSAKVLHAGDGYTYLTREVASADVQRERGQSLADYYTAAGAPPGRWMGSGIAALGVEGRVSEDQMKALFGAGLHPDAFARIAAKRTDIIGSQAWRKAYTRAAAEAADELGVKPSRLPEEAAAGVRERVAGRVFKIVEHRDANSPEELTAWVERMTELNHKQDRWHAALDKRIEEAAKKKNVEPAKLPKAEVASIRSELAAQMHAAIEGQPAASPEDLASWVDRMDAPEMTTAQAERLAARWLRQEQLGRAFPAFDTTKHDTWLAESKAALEDAAKEAGVEVDELDPEHREQVLAATAARVFEQVEHRLPKTQTELSTWVQRMEEKPRQPVAGYDLVFTPPKSYSVLWALGDEATRRAVEEAHHAAVRSAMKLLESEVAFTRTGAAGIAQVETRGIIATAFDHYDSRAGDPNLHTHFAVSNKVQGRDGKWRALDGRVLHAAFVSVSTHYGAVVKAELAERLPGLRHQARATGRDKRPVYEIAGIPRELCTEFSQRREAMITGRFEELMADYRAKHGRDPSPAVQHKLAEQATLQTRPPKKGLESLAEKVAGWMPRAVPHLWAAGYDGLTAVQIPELMSAVARGSQVPREPVEHPTALELAEDVLDAVSSERSEWKSWHLRNEAARQIEALDGLSPAQAAALITAVTDQAVGLSIPLDPPEIYSRVTELERSNGESIYSVHGQRQFSSAKVFEAEERVLRATSTPISPLVAERNYQRWAEANTDGLSTDQARLVERFATSERLLEVAAGAAGSGKSTAMQKLADLAREQGVTVRAAAPSAVAAEELAEKIGGRGETLAKLLLEAKTSIEESTIGRGDLVIVDEASMASTRDLDRLVEICAHKGARLRLLGDPYQLDAVEQGGLFRTLVEQTDAVELTTLHRFRDQIEAKQTLRLRTGDVEGLDWYFRHGRVHGGTRERLLEAIYTDWQRDRSQGLTSLMMVGDNETARTLSERARLDLVVAGVVEREGVELHNGSVAGIGDVIVTRRNERKIRAGRGFVKNGHTWTVTDRAEDGSLTVRNNADGSMTVLPPVYVGEHVELGYASTIHRAQGVTVDRGRILGDAMMGRNAFYVGMTRGREQNHAYVVTEATVDLDLHHATDAPQSGRAVLEAIVRHDDSARSAHDTIATNYEAAESLAQIIPEYDDVRLRQAQRDNEILAAFEAAGIEGDELAALRSSTAWHTLQDRVLDLTDRGTDAGAALRAARAEGELPHGHGDDPAAVLAERLPNAEASRLARLVEPSDDLDVERVEDGTLERALIERRVRAAARVDTLLDRARSEEWTSRTFGEEPAEEEIRAEWQQAVRYAAAYRDRYAVRDQTKPLGAEPETEGRQRDDWRHGQQLVTRALARLHEHARRQPTSTPAAPTTPTTSTRTTLDQSMARLRRLSRTGEQARDPEPTTREDPMERLRKLRAQTEANERARENREDEAAREAAEAQRLREEQERAERQRQLEEQQRAQQERDQGYGRDL